MPARSHNVYTALALSGVLVSLLGLIALVVRSKAILGEPGLFGF